MLVVGFIMPPTDNFCESCNRVRLTCAGTLYMCLGQEDCGFTAHECHWGIARSLAPRRSAKQSLEGLAAMEQVLRGSPGSGPGRTSA